MPNPLSTRDTATIRDAILRVRRSGLIARGVANPDVSPGSAAYIDAQAIANQLVITEANGETSADQILPDTSTGEKFAQLCAVFGVEGQPASSSVGNVILDATSNCTIVAGVNDLLVDGAGLEFTATAGTYAPGDPVPVTSKSTGDATNHDEGDVLRWVNTPPTASDKALVDVGGLINGSDAEDEETVRETLKMVLREPPVSGNATDISLWAKKSSANVEAGFVYPAIRGGSTFALAVTAAARKTDKSRALSGAIVSGVVVPYLAAKYPEYADAIITNTTDVNADVAFGITIPEAPNAALPGTGGGWVNGTPWPAPDGATSFRCTVTAVTSSSQFTVDAATAPTPFVTKICWLDPTPGSWALFSATVVAVSGSAGAYLITLDTAWSNIAIGCYIWPACQNAQAYVDAVLGSFAKMGPGEKTSNVSALIRGFRRPRPAVAWPSSLGSHLTDAVTKAQAEVQSAQFFHRTDGATTLTGSGGLVLPQPPALLTDAPNIFVPRHIGLYRVP